MKGLSITGLHQMIGFRASGIWLALSILEVLIMCTRMAGVRGIYWVAAKDLKLCYYIGETLLFTIYIYPLW